MIYYINPEGRSGAVAGNLTQYWLV